MTLRQVVEKSWAENRLFSVLLELTYRCNLDCFFCYNDIGLRGKPMMGEHWIALLEELRDLGVLNVALSGGEPLAHPDFFKIGAKARELGFVTRIKSNGHAVHGELARRIREEIDPFLIEVSLHGAVASTHDQQTRVAGSFDRLLKNIREMRALGLRVKANSTLTAWNECEVEGMFAITDDLGIALRFDMQVTPRDNGDREPMSISPSNEGIRRLLQVESDRFRRFSGGEDPHPAARPVIDDEIPAPSGKYCGAGSAGVAVDPYGNVYPCVQWRRPSGNLHEQSMREIWMSSGVLAGIRTTTAEIPGKLAGEANAALLNFCPGLAEMLTGRPDQVPQEMRDRAAVIADATKS